MSPTSQTFAKISGPIVMVGFGSIGKGTLPLIERHLDYDKSRVTVIDPKDEGRKAHCEKHNVRFIQKGVPWAHLDIAGVVWNEKGTVLSAPGATGYGVRLLNQFVADNYEK